MKRCREFVDGFMEWLAPGGAPRADHEGARRIARRIVEAVNFAAMCLAMAIAMWMVVTGWVALIVVVVGSVACGALAGAVAMWVIYAGGRDEMALVYERRDLAVDNAVAIVEAHTPPEPMPAVQIHDATTMSHTAPKSVRTLLIHAVDLISRW